MMHALNEEAFTEGRAELEHIAPAPLFKYYLGNWDTIQQMWVLYLCNKHLNLGNNTNNLVESHNNQIKCMMRHSDKLHSAAHGLILMHGVKLRETQHTHIRAEGTHFYSHNSQSHLVKETSHLLTVYATKRLIYKQRKCLETLDTASVCSDEEGNVVRTTNGAYTVQGELSSCTCGTYLTMKIPCRHIIKVHTHLNISINFNLCTHRRWFKMSQYCPRFQAPSLNEPKPRPDIEVLHGPNLAAMSRTSKYNYAFRIVKQVADYIAESGSRSFEKRLSVVEVVERLSGIR